MKWVLIGCGSLILLGCIGSAIGFFVCKRAVGDIAEQAQKAQQEAAANPAETCAKAKNCCAAFMRASNSPESACAQIETLPPDQCAGQLLGYRMSASAMGKSDLPECQ